MNKKIKTILVTKPPMPPLDELYEFLKINNIYGRRYFYPLVSEFLMYKGLDSVNPINLLNAKKMAKQVICLPIYPELKVDEVNEIIKFIKS